MSDRPYKEVTAYYNCLEKAINDVHKNVMTSFSHLHQFIMSGPRLVESLDRLAGAETAPLADAVHGARDFIDAALKNFGTTYQLLLEVTALCTEMRS